MLTLGVRVNKFDKLLQMSKKEIETPSDLSIDSHDSKSRTLRT